MARKTDQKAAAAAKVRRQKIFLIVGSVALLGLLAFQGPKVMKQLNGSSTAESTEQTTTTTTSGSTATPTTPSTPAASGSSAPAAPPPVSRPAPGGTAQLAGVVIAVPAPPAAEEGQLSSFSRFAPKDPFDPLVDTDQPVSSGPPPTSSGSSSSPSQPSSGGQPSKPAGEQPSTPSSPTTSAGGDATTSPDAELDPTLAVLSVNGKLLRLAPATRFPATDRAFVLVSLARGSVKIGVAGGAYADGAKTLTLGRGKKVTLVNTATGASYTIKLLYVGSGEVTAFASKATAKK